jgi:NitT/TauT family transport system permease protein
MPDAIATTATTPDDLEIDEAEATGWFRRNERWFLPGFTFVAVFALWEIGARAGWLHPVFFSSPSAVIIAGIAEVQDPRFWNDVWISSIEFLVGYTLALIIGVAVGLVTGWYRRAAYFMDPWLAAFNSMPRVALLPLVVLYLGLGIWSKVGLVFLGVFFPVALNTFHGVRTVDPRFRQVTRSFRASERKVFVTLVLPSVVPFIASAARIGVGRGVAGVAIGEFFTSQAGLMHMIRDAAQFLETDRVLFGTLVITVLALGVYATVQLIETRVQRRYGKVV